MSGNYVTELIRGRGEVVEQRPLLRGYISAFVGTSPGKQITAPSAFPIPGQEHNLAWVVTPEYSTVRPLGPCQWTAEHGSRLPKQFAKCVVSMDSEGIPTIIWWEGEQKESSGGGGEEYKAGEGLEESGSKPVTFKAKLGEGLEFLTGKIQVAVGAGLELAAGKLLIKAKGVTDAMLKETYAILGGRAGGQTLYGGTAPGESLMLGPNPEAVYLTLNGVEGKLVVTPGLTLEVEIIQALVSLQVEGEMVIAFLRLKGTGAAEPILENTAENFHFKNAPVLIDKELTVEELLTAKKGLTVVGTLTLPSESLTEAAIKKEAVSAPKALIATTPTPGVEEKVVPGTAGVARKITAAITGKTGVTSYKIKHSLETQAVQVSVQEATSKKPGVYTAVGAGFVVTAWEATSASEIKITTTLAAGKEIFVTIVG